MINDYTKTKIPDVSVEMPEQVNWLHKKGNLHPACYDCINRRKTTTDGQINPQTGKPDFKKGEFLVNCTGIPLNYLKVLPDHVISTMSEEEIEAFLESQDPVYWAYKNLDWFPRKSKGGIEYQKILVACSATRKMSRIGRRSGKTAALAVKALRHAFLHAVSTKSGVEAASGGTNTGDVLVVAPYGYQTAIIFDEIRNLILKSTTKISHSIRRDVKNPHELHLSNGSKIIGRTASEKSGGKAESIRGAGGSLIVFDEMDYLGNDSVETVMAILTENPKAILWGSSTPKGRRDSKYYQFCNSPFYAEFHWPSQVSPAWTEKAEMETRLDYDRMSYEREILAEWGEQRGGVFPVQFVEKAIKNYEYEYGPYNNPRNPDWVYTMGVDWNQNTGTQIVVVGVDEHGVAFVVDRADVDPKQWKQMDACRKIRDLNRDWRCDAIYVDDGFGAAQTEWLHAMGESAFEELARYRRKGGSTTNKYLTVDAMLKDTVRAINFSSKESLIDPTTGLEDKKPAKAAMVQNCMRRFEQNTIHFPETDNLLKDQLLAYVELRVTPAGLPIYGSSEPTRMGDHIADALFLALWAITKEFSSFGSRHYDIQMAFSEKPWKHDQYTVNSRTVGKGSNNINRALDTGNYDRMNKRIPEPDERLKQSLLGELYPSRNPNKESFPVSGARPINGSGQQEDRMLDGPRIARNSVNLREKFSREL